MCATFTTLPAGKLLSDTLKSIEFVALLMVITAVPRAVASAFVIGGTSFSADNGTVNTVMSLGDGPVLLPPHPATAKPRIVTATSARRFIVVLLVSQYVKSKRQRKNDGEADGAGIEIRHVRISGSS